MDKIPPTPYQPPHLDAANPRPASRLRVTVTVKPADRRIPTPSGQDYLDFEGHPMPPPNQNHVYSWWGGTPQVMTLLVGGEKCTCWLYTYQPPLSHEQCLLEYVRGGPKQLEGWNSGWVKAESPNSAHSRVLDLFEQRLQRLFPPPPTQDTVAKHSDFILTPAHLYPQLPEIEPLVLFKSQPPDPRPVARLLVKALRHLAGQQKPSSQLEKKLTAFFRLQLMQIKCEPSRRAIVKRAMPHTVDGLAALVEAFIQKLGEFLARVDQYDDPAEFAKDVLAEAFWAAKRSTENKYLADLFKTLAGKGQKEVVGLLRKMIEVWWNAKDNADLSRQLADIGWATTTHAFALALFAQLGPLCQLFFASLVGELIHRGAKATVNAVQEDLSADQIDVFIFSTNFGKPLWQQWVSEAYDPTPSSPDSPLVKLIQEYLELYQKQAGVDVAPLPYSNNNADTALSDQDRGHFLNPLDATAIFTPHPVFSGPDFKNAAEALALLPRHNPQLRALSLHEIHQREGIDGDGVVRALAQLSHLESLTLTLDKTTPVVLTGPTSLASLKISWNTSYPPPVEPACFPNLQSLDLRLERRMWGQGVNLQFLTQLPALTRLTLIDSLSAFDCSDGYQWSQPIGYTLAPLLGTLTDLKHLVIGLAPAGATGHERLRALTNIESLRIVSREAGDWTKELELFRQMPNLKGISLSEVLPPTPEGAGG